MLARYFYTDAARGGAEGPMTATKDWHSAIVSECRLSAPFSRQLHDIGFIVLPGPVTPRGGEQLSRAYDREFAAASPADVHRGKTGSSTRVDDFVNRGAEFDGIYIHPPLLAACCQVIGGPFKLSDMRARTLNPGASMERLHVDVRHRANGWPLVGCILMVDTFDAENGATRFVPGSHLNPSEPHEMMDDSQSAHEEEVSVFGPAGSIIIFNASVWHGHGANRSSKPRRSLQLHFSPRKAEPAPNDPAARMSPDTLQRIGDLAKYVLNIK
jgi:hypothetical protein